MLAALTDAGHEAIIKPWPVRPPVPGGFTIDEFTVDEAAGVAPARPDTPARSTAVARSSSAPPAAAADSAPGAPPAAADAASNSATTTLTRAHRRRPRLQALYRQHRPMAERSIAWLTRDNRRSATGAPPRTTPGCTPGPAP